ncbi:TIGR02678 family protein [Allosaccharopolyspora coralli]|uniref:TIGR02678 family protein n=1 Tax=Allosaccharopolyspora coralli TaxID=2665642 RepID=A0A5Q3Q7E4_9PSEU|nr:TIGR02678 family protein [Allosaccharopolyspora coralli]QGK69356.1 TIGR02678 family protein [Allosaccharopolyspora coralli]
MSARERTVASFDELPDIDAANVVRCARVLLRRPMLHAGGQDGDLLPMIHRRRSVLQDVFSSLLGYRLVVERRFARLHKAGPGSDATRGEPSLGPRGYAHLALTLAALTGIGRQVLLSRLVVDVRAAAVEAGVAVADDPADRRALTAALRHLVSLGVITETEGAVSPLATDSSAEALITIDTDLLGQLVSGPLGDATSPDELIERATAVGPRQVEHAVRRRLVEDPVVVFRDFPAEQETWLLEHLRSESELLERFFGLVTETRSEGIVVSDPEDYLTDLTFPGPGTVARIALLALPDLLGLHEPRQADGRHPVTRDEVAEVCATLVESYPAAWSRVAVEDPEALVDDVTGLLRRLGLLDQDRPDGWWLSPAAHRWIPEPDATPAQSRESEPPPAPVEPSWSLFDGADEADATKEPAGSADTREEAQ